MAVTFRDRRSSLAALAIPVLAGIGWMAAFDAPYAFLAVDALALVLGLTFAAVGRIPDSALFRRLATIALIALLFVPLITGPYVNSIARWIPLGPIALHSGIIALPALSVLAARDRHYAAPILLAALFAVFLQPDAATGFAITFAAVGLHHIGKDWKVGTVCIVAFFAAIFMSLNGELPAQRFVENVLRDVLVESPLVWLVLSLSLAVSFFLMLFGAPLARAERFALAGSLFGFVIMAMMNHYPYPFIGHGAAPIIGYGLALGLVRSETAA